MPRAWLGRFGRTVGEQVLDAVEARMRAPRAAGSQVRLAGHRLGLGADFGAEPGGEAAAARRARLAEAEEQGASGGALGLAAGRGVRGGFGRWPGLPGGRRPGPRAR